MTTTVLYLHFTRTISISREELFELRLKTTLEENLDQLRSTLSTQLTQSQAIYAFDQSFGVIADSSALFSSLRDCWRYSWRVYGQT